MEPVNQTVLLDVQIDQGEAQKGLVQAEKNILNLKKQQAELNKEYKAGKITQDAYVQANLRLQKAISKETDQKRTLKKLIDTESNSRNALKNRVSQLTKEYDNLNVKTVTGAKRADELQKELSQLNAEITKSSKSAGLFKDQIGNYPQQFQKMGASFASATNEVKPFGLSVQGATGELSKFASPAGAVLGVISLLGASYAKSAKGARDLEKAHLLLSYSFSLANEGLAEFISGSKESEGVITGITTAILARYVPSLYAVAAAAANAAEQLKELQISRAFAAGFAKEDERRAELLRRIRDDENESLQTRLATITKIDQILTQSSQRTVIVIRAQIQAIKDSTIGYEFNRDAQERVAALAGEIKDKEEEITGKLTENVTARRNILKLIEEERKLTAADDRAQRRALDTAPTFREFNPDLIADIGQKEIRANEIINDHLLKVNQDFYDRDIEAKRKAAAIKEQIQWAELQTAAVISGAAASLFDQQSVEYKAFASAQTLISTYAAATKAYEAAFVPPTIASPVLGSAYAAAAIAQGLANLAAINGVQFAEGGFTGQGSKYQPAGIVHAGEYVAPQSVVNSPAAQPHISALEGMRTGKRGFADGGFVSEQMISPYQMAMITANAIRSMPAPVVGVREFVKVQNRVEVREQMSRR